MAAGVPDELWLVESFLNSIDVESGQDDLDSVPRFQRWLRDHRQPAAAGSAGAADLELARAVRAELREIAHEHGHPGGGSAGAGSGGSPRLDALAEQAPLRVRFARGIGLAPVEPGVRGMLGEVLGAVVLADRTGSWRRLKLCREGSCQVAFYDRSKNGSRCWCSMQVCGNRSKTRAYRTRHR